MIGEIARNQVPMIVTFDEAHVEFICDILGDSLIRAYNIIDMFDYKEDEELW